MYAALELGTSGAPACPDSPQGIAGEEATLICKGSNRLLIFISEHPVYVQLGYMKHGAAGISTAAVDWQPPKPFLPCAASLYREFDAVRVYNYTSGEAAQVLLSVDSR